MNYTKNELKILRKLNTPAKIQDYINSLKFNFENNGETLRSPRNVLKYKEAHCLEGALLASAIFNFHKIENYLLDLKCKKNALDYDHVVCVFRIKGHFGAISKTNHAVLRYREPIYKTWRELAMSFYHEYFINTGEKTLESFSTSPFLVSRFKPDFAYNMEDLWEISERLDKIKHTRFAPKGFRTRKADAVEIKASKIVEYKRN